MITSLYNRYFQKSRSFLFPALGIAKSLHPPIQTFISLNDTIKPADQKLVCLFQHSSTEKYERFETDSLYGNPLYYDSEVNPNEPSIYIFSFEALKTDWEYFLQGKYSQLSGELKQAIRNYYGEKTPEYAYVDSFLYPHNYFEVYASLLGESVQTLQSVGELCDPYDAVKEKLLFSTRMLGKMENKSISL